jgi:hypothetical protein
VRVVIQIQLTHSYGPYIARPTGSRSGLSHRHRPASL